jgi:hypothetical protein
VYEHKIRPHFEGYCFHLPTVINNCMCKKQALLMDFYVLLCQWRLIAALFHRFLTAAELTMGLLCWERFIKGLESKTTVMINNNYVKALCSQCLHSLKWQTQLLPSVRLDSPKTLKRLVPFLRSLLGHKPSFLIRMSQALLPSFWKHLILNICNHKRPQLTN